MDANLVVVGALELKIADVLFVQVVNLRFDLLYEVLGYAASSSLLLSLLECAEALDLQFRGDKRPGFRGVR